MSNKQIDDKILDQVDDAKRSSVRKILAGGFVLPTVATFSMSAMTAKTAHAATCSNCI